MPRGLKVHLVGVDPEIDFMGEDDGSPYEEITNGIVYKATLPVKGATADMKRAAALVRRTGPKLSDNHITLDAHHPMHIAHPYMWRDQDGRPPAGYTPCPAADVGRIWWARNPAHQSRFKVYCEALEVKGRVHRFWNPHCLIGGRGMNVHPDLWSALCEWETQNMGVVNYVTKGSSVWTEHFGALMAEVPDPEDPSTQLNTEFLTLLDEADILGFYGEALDFCVKRTMQQVIENLGVSVAKKITLLTDCSSPIFPDEGAKFLAEMQAIGVTLMKSTDFLA
jgi:nicotinamidase-related amidase